MTDWGTLAGTALGALLGIGSTLVVDRARWRRDQRDRSNELRRVVYGEYLTALSRTRNRLRDVAADPRATPEERLGQVREIVTEGRAYELRHQVQLIAPDEVVALSEITHLALRGLRDQVVAGQTSDSAGYLEKRAAYITASRDLFESMRRDLGEADD